MSTIPDPFAFLSGPSVEVAPRLLGCVLARTIGADTARVQIVETEAYDETDPASHSFHGPSARTSVMFGPPGHLYVYFTYGMHYCCNVVTGPAGHGAAVLLRAGQPLSGESAMALRRHGLTGIATTNGPAKLCQALDIDRALNGHDLSDSPLTLEPSPPLDPAEIVQTRRIGISRAQDRPWRFYIRDNPYVSLP